MKTNEKEVFRLTSDEAEYIKDLIIKNEHIIRAKVRSILQDKYGQLGEDCISEIYLLACKKIAVLKKHGNPDGWIMVAASRIAQNMARKHNTLMKNSTDVEITDVSAAVHVFEDALYDIWMEEGSIDKLLNTLTPHEREIYDLIFKKRLSSKEAAILMGISDSTIRNTVAKIKRKIKNAIETELF